MRKLGCLILSLLFIFCLLSGCSEKETGHLKIGMLSNGQSFTEDPFNISTWSAVVDSSNAYECDYTYAEPNSTDIEDLKSAVDELYNSGCRMIVAGDDILREVISQSQSKYSDCKFVCVGFTLDKISSNTVCLTFSQLESGFIAGIAAAMHLKSGVFGGIFGMDIPSAEKYAAGFTYGIDYANSNLGTNVAISKETIIYVGSYNDPDLAKQLASKLYTSGVSCIFTDGGATSDGVFEAAKEAVASGSIAWVIGSDVDRYARGITDADRSVTLTSAVSVPAPALSSVVSSYLENSFSGGKLLTFTATDNTVGIADSHSILSAEVVSTCRNVLSKLQDGSLKLKDPTDLVK